MEQTFFPNHKPMVSAFFYCAYSYDLEPTQVFMFSVSVNGVVGLRAAPDHQGCEEEL